MTKLLRTCRPNLSHPDDTDDNDGTWIWSTSRTVNGTGNRSTQMKLSLCQLVHHSAIWITLGLNPALRILKAAT